MNLSFLTKCLQKVLSYIIFGVKLQQYIIVTNKYTYQGRSQEVVLGFPPLLPEMLVMKNFRIIQCFTPKIVLTAPKKYSAYGAAGLGYLLLKLIRI